MDNYTQTKINQTLNRTIDNITGEILHEETINLNYKKTYYLGPRKYWRLMELYDKAQLLLGSRAGILIMVFLKSQVDTKSYRITLNKTWLAEDLNLSRDAVIKNIKKLVDNGYIIKEDRSQYFIHPGMYYSGDIDDKSWQELKQDYLVKLLKLNIKDPVDDIK